MIAFYDTDVFTRVPLLQILWCTLDFQIFDQSPYAIQPICSVGVNRWYPLQPSTSMGSILKHTLELSESSIFIDIFRLHFLDSLVSWCLSPCPINFLSMPWRKIWQILIVGFSKKKWHSPMNIFSIFLQFSIILLAHSCLILLSAVQHRVWKVLIKILSIPMHWATAASVVSVPHHDRFSRFNWCSLLFQEELWLRFANTCIQMTIKWHEGFSQAY